MLPAVVCGFLCGCRGWTSLAEWLNDQPLDVCHWMGSDGAPKQDCFRDLLRKLDPTVLEQVIRRWISDDVTEDMIKLIPELQFGVTPGNHQTLSKTNKSRSIRRTLQRQLSLS